MRTGVFSSTIGVRVLAVVLAAILAALALSTWGGSSFSGLNDGGRIKGVVEWTHRDAGGAVLGQSLRDNTTLDEIKNDARDRLGFSSTLTDADLYDEIALLSDNPGGLATGTLSTNTTENNPQEGAGTQGGTGEYSVVLTFTATGTVTIEELQLVNGDNGDTEVPIATEIGAWQNVSVTLENGDTLTVTWTITVS